MNIELLETKLSKHAKKKRKSVRKMEAQYDKAFERQATFLGNGIYGIAGLYSTDTRELKVMFILQQEGVKFKEKDNADDHFNEE